MNVQVYSNVREDKLADPAPKQPLALTLGAAAVTLLVVVGVLAGPSVVNCFNSSDGMGICLRGKMTDAGLLGPQPMIATQPDVAAQKPEAEVAVATPQLDVTPPAESATPAPAAVPAAADGLIAATFGLLRAEPDGSVVIAGSGTPGSEVEVYSNGELLGTAKVESSGDWVLVPDQPIQPGGTELTLAENGKEGQSAESFVVVINEDKTSEPLVVASTPGQASEILQGLERPESRTTTELASADPVTPPATAVQPTPAVAASPAPAAAPVEQVAAPAAPSEPVAETPTVAEPAAPTETTAAPAATPEVAATPELAAPAETIQPAAPTEVAAAPAEPAPTPVPDQQVAVADPVQPTPAVPEVVLANVPPTIDAIEIEDERNFFAGGGPDGAVIRLYVDGTYIADATVEAGRWLVESANVLTKPSQRIRIDMLKPGTADVAARAEVDFVVDLPEPEAPTAVAVAEPAAPQPTPTVAEPTTTTSEPAAQPEVAVAVATPTPEAPAASTAPAEQPAAAVSSGTNTAPATPAVPAVTPAAPAPVATAIAEPATPSPAEPATTAPTETAAAPAEASAPVAEPAQPSVAVAEPAQPAATPVPEAPAPTVVAEATPPAEAATTDDSVPTLVAVQVGEPGDQRFASGKAIIRRGDNLWTIARRVYGQGIKYTTIYAANDGQIRNPNRIYPGQVFDLPTSAD